VEEASYIGYSAVAYYYRAYRVRFSAFRGLRP